MNKKKIKTLTIKRDMVESLASDEDKLDFVNSVISLLTDRQAANGTTGEISKEGLNDDLPEPLAGSPEFDSSNMAAPEYKRYSMVRAGSFPVNLNCGYAEYRYKHRDEYSEDELETMFCDIGSKMYRSKGKKGLLAFLNYIQEVMLWYRNNVKRK